MERLLHDLRSSGRSLRRHPIVTIVAVLSLAIGIGATTATLMMREVLFRNPPPLYTDPDQLSKVQTSPVQRPIMPIGGYVPGPVFATWRDGLGLPFAAATPVGGTSDVRTSDRKDTAVVRAVTSDFFGLLGISPLHGRLFNASDEPASGAASAVLSHRVWEEIFDASPDAVGSVIWIDERPHTVIGVLPQRFWFSAWVAPIWTVLGRDAAAASDGLHVVVRRPSGLEPEALATRLRAGLTDYASRLPAGEREWHMRVSDLRGTPIGDQMSIVLPYVLSMSVLLTLLIACANVAILIIAQWTERENEIAIRAALGAHRGRIVRGLLTESVLLALVAGALGGGATFLVRAAILYQAGSGGPEFFDLSIRPALFLQVAALTLATGVVAGVVPAILETKRLQTNPLRVMRSLDRARQRWSQAFVVLEITATFALLVVTATMIESYRLAMQAQLGFRTAPLLSMRVENRRGVAVDQLIARVGALPGVSAAAAGTRMPVWAPGRPQRVAADAVSAGVTAEESSIGKGFFAALDVPMRAGRAFTDQDSPATRTVVVNESLARRLFQTANAVGRQVWIDGETHDVVGVVADYVSHPMRTRMDPAKVFRPLARGSALTDVRILVRAADNPVPLVLVIERAARDADAGNVVTNANTMDQVTDIMGKEQVAGTAPFVPLILIGMLLTAAGIYGVLAFAITRRTQELALRAAIGASRADQVRLVAAHGGRLVVIGCAIGIVVTYGLARLVRAAGGAGSSFDPTLPAFLVPLAIVVVVGVVATWIPSRRAMRISPAVLLKTT